MKKTSSNDDATKPDRKTVERNRRIRMKGLCFKLASLIPDLHYINPSRDMVSQQDKLDYATRYITQLRERIEKLKRRKEQVAVSSLGTGSWNMIDDTYGNGSWLPIVDLRDLGSSIEVILISGLQKNFMYEVTCILQEEGAEVVSSSFSTVGDKIFHTVHAQAKISRIGVETSRVWQRLQELKN
ncbi:transcription factor bHLH162-like [Juglans microcarpa x Juglans regia]|uniref:transcription factor bHLH162-like n=1 Tax=Juglans microcarpa x Juglans regia TaxID=2249226 RepID=UPI001B7EC016|nr:transcription factor bHLH162-like [Juglans microcarpa x Juglans regia]